MFTVKLLLNSVISTQGEKITTIDIKDFYLNTLMPRYEYMRLKLEDLPEDFTEEYKLREQVVKDGYAYIKIRKGMYGFLESGILLQELSAKQLNAKGCRQSTPTPGFWAHDWRPISFGLVVDNSGVKYVGK